MERSKLVSFILRQRSFLVLMLLVLEKAFVTVYLEGPVDSIYI
jgi:hypothetical protein